MVRAFACMIMATFLTQAADGPTTAIPAPASVEVPSALKSGAYPWYDSVKDEIKPVELPRVPTSQPSQASPTRATAGSWSWLGQVLQFLGFALAIGILLGLLIWLYKVYEPSAEAGLVESKTNRGVATQASEELPAGLRDEFASSNPWDEAVRRRQRGDLAGAVVCLFAHQLLTLSRLGLVRLAPGRTGRQLVKAVSDVEFRGYVHPTLSLFELVYYGHQSPTVEAFETVWIGAEAFERRVSVGGRS